jgi:hypothetical protein
LLPLHPIQIEEILKRGFQEVLKRLFDLGDFGICVLGDKYRGFVKLFREHNLAIVRIGCRTGYFGDFRLVGNRTKNRKW